MKILNLILYFINWSENFQKTLCSVNVVYFVLWIWVVNIGRLYPSQFKPRVEQFFSWFALLSYIRCGCQPVSAEVSCFATIFLGIFFLGLRSSSFYIFDAAIARSWVSLERFLHRLFYQIRLQASLKACSTIKFVWFYDYLFVF